MNRRDFLAASTGAAAVATTGVAASMNAGSSSLLELLTDTTAQSDHRIRAVLFDGFPIFDPRPIFACVKTHFPDEGEAMSKLWFSKIFGYTWIRTLGERYVGFEEVISDALEYAAAKHNLTLTDPLRDELLGVWTTLEVWDDVKPALKKLSENNIKIGFLSNLSEAMLRANAEHSGISELVDFYLSTDRVRAYKPSPIAYQMGPDELGIPKDQLAFAAFGAWDAVGADWFGFQTIWVNRFGFPKEELDAQGVIHETDMAGLLRAVH